jgi:hypothetical protein
MIGFATDGSQAGLAGTLPDSSVAWKLVHSFPGPHSEHLRAQGMAGQDRDSTSTRCFHASQAKATKADFDATVVLHPTAAEATRRTPTVRYVRQAAE